MRSTKKFSSSCLSSILAGAPLERFAISVCCLILSTTLAFGSQKQIFSYTLGQTPVTVEKYTTMPLQNGVSSHVVSPDIFPLVYFHPHENEVTSFEQTKKFIDSHGGTLIAIKQGGQRLIHFTLEHESYTFDPNRIFTRNGVKETLSKYGHYSAIAADKVYDFGLWLLGILSNPRIVAVHNNYNKGYNIRSYKRGDPGVKNLYINPHQSTGSFLYTTNARLFAFAKEKAINVILQRITATDDGSYSIFAQRHHIDYVNIESMRGDAVNMRKLLAYVYTFYNKRNLMQECPMQGYHQRGHRGHVHYKRHHHNTTEHH